MLLLLLAVGLTTFMLPLRLLCTLLQLLLHRLQAAAAAALPPLLI
jgi:hypothetical protein